MRPAETAVPYIRVLRYARHLCVHEVSYVPPGTLTNAQMLGVYCCKAVAVCRSRTTVWERKKLEATNRAAVNSKYPYSRMCYRSSI